MIEFVFEIECLEVVLRKNNDNFENFKSKFLYCAQLKNYF